MLNLNYSDAEKIYREAITSVSSKTDLEDWVSYRTKLLNVLIDKITYFGDKAALQKTDDLAALTSEQILSSSYLEKYEIEDLLAKVRAYQSALKEIQTPKMDDHIPGMIHDSRHRTGSLQRCK